MTNLSFGAPCLQSSIHCADVRLWSSGFAPYKPGDGVILGGRDSRVVALPCHRLQSHSSWARHRECEYVGRQPSINGSETLYNIAENVTGLAEDDGSIWKVQSRSQFR